MVYIYILARLRIFLIKLIHWLCNQNKLFCFRRFWHWALSLGACRKKNNPLPLQNRNTQLNQNSTNNQKPPNRNTWNTYIIKVSADDANTSIVWKEDFDISSEEISAKNITKNKIIDSLADQHSYNVNDAKVFEVSAKYKGDKSGELFSRDSYTDDEGFNGSQFQTDVQIPEGSDLVVTAKARETRRFGYSKRYNEFSGGAPPPHMNSTMAQREQKVARFTVPRFQLW